MEKEKNVTNEKDFEKLPFIKCKRLDTKELKGKDNKSFYLLQIIFETEDKKAMIDIYFKDADLYAELLNIPLLADFKLYYEVVIGFDNNLKLQPLTCSL